MCDSVMKLALLISVIEFGLDNFQQAIFTCFAGSLLLELLPCAKANPKQAP